MKYRQIGQSNLQVSVVGLGCNNFGGRLSHEESHPVIERALERGINFFDTSDTYGKDRGSERVLGEVLGPHRKDVVIATKFGWPLDDSGQRQGASRRYVFTAVEASLKTLKTDWIDLYQLHRPDPDTPIEETLRALEDLIKQGKVRYAACSSFSAGELSLAQRQASEIGCLGFVSSQDHYNLLTRKVEETVVPELRRLGMSLLPYAPLAGGLLTGKYRHNAPMPKEGRITNSPKQAERYLSDANWRIIENLVSFSSQRGRSLLDLSFAWVASRDPVCSVIAGAMSPAQIDANVHAADWALSDEELLEIDKITGGLTDLDEKTA